MFRYGETVVSKIITKSRMRERRTYGSVRSDSFLSHKTNCELKEKKMKENGNRLLDKRREYIVKVLTLIGIILMLVIKLDTSSLTELVFDLI